MITMRGFCSCVNVNVNVSVKINVDAFFNVVTPVMILGLGLCC